MRRKKIQDQPKKSSEPLSLLSWSSPSRLFKKRDARYFITVAVVVAVLVVLLLFLRELLLVAVILAVAFVIYVLATVPPDEVSHEIRSDGLLTATAFYPWQDLGAFWFGKRHGHELLLLETKLRFPGRLTLLLGNTSREQLIKTLSPHLAFRENPQESFLEAASQKIAEVLGH